MKKSILMLLFVLLLTLPGLAEEQNPYANMSDEELLEMQISLRQELIDRELLESSLIYPGKYIVGVDIRPGTYRFNFASAEFNAIIVTHFRNVDQYNIAYEGGFSTNSVDKSGGVELYVKKGSPAQFVLEEGHILYTYYGICYIESVEKPSWAP